MIGNIKQNLGFREFLLKSLDKVKMEMNLVCIAYNLGKIWRLRGGITAQIEGYYFFLCEEVLEKELWDGVRC